ncbi:hypothetical protein K438DRAFT_1799065 [Mycena galopus ATCC 62051]|nr:hypothetical protein K438DRAFT_1799065 [Mycena galopus ATCC 62051]
MALSGTDMLVVCTSPRYSYWSSTCAKPTLLTAVFTSSQIQTKKICIVPATQETHAKSSSQHGAQVLNQPTRLHPRKSRVCPTRRICIFHTSRQAHCPPSDNRTRFGLIAQFARRPTCKAAALLERLSGLSQPHQPSTRQRGRYYIHRGNQTPLSLHVCGSQTGALGGGYLSTLYSGVEFAPAPSRSTDLFNLFVAQSFPSIEPETFSSLWLNIYTFIFAPTNSFKSGCLLQRVIVPA